jgi:chromosome segregation ATPase
MRLSSKNRYCAILQEEINSLKLASKRERKYDDQRVVEFVTDMISDDRTTVNSEDISVLEKDLSDLREKEESLRNYVDLLEEDKAHIDKELGEHKNKVVWHENENKKLLNTISEQKETISSLVDLLDLRERDHEEKVAGHIEQVSILESKYKELETRLNAEAQIAVQAEQKMISTQSANIHLKEVSGDIWATVIVRLNAHLRFTIFI